MLTQIINGHVFTPQGWLNEGSVLVKDGKILEIANCDLALIGASLVDAKGMYTASGFVYMHAHGRGGYNFTGYTEEAFRTAIAAHMKHSVTSFFPTLPSSPFSEVHEAVDMCGRLMAESDSPILGLHVEGPHLSHKMAGGQFTNQMKEVDVAEYTSLLESTDCIKRWDVSPELPGALDFARYLKSRGTIGAVSHTGAEYGGIKGAYEAGFTHATHFYNAMPGFHKCHEYKCKGTAESVYLTDGVIIELIADGIHLPSTILKLAHKLKGVEHTCLVIDALSCAAAEDRAIGDPRIIIEDGVCRLVDRSTLAGSIAIMDQLVHTMVKADIPLADAIRMAPETPARIMGICDHKGSLQKDKDAGILTLDRDLNVRVVWAMGQLVKES